MKFDPTATGDKGGEAAATQAGIAVLQAVAGEPLVVADGAWLLSSQFARQGSDLLLTGADGSQVLIRDYFRLQTPPDLMTAGGALVRADLAVKLAGPLAPGQYAQTTAGESTEPIGRVESVDGTVEVVRTDGTRETLSEGDPIFQGDVLETSADGTIGIVFVDDTTFSLAENGRMTLDEFVYDPGGEEGTFKASLVQGVFSFVSGEVAKLGPESMTVSTPTATIGIRGTTVAGRAAAEGELNTITLLPDENGQVGEIAVTNDGGTVVLNAPGATVQVSSFSQAPPPPVILTPDQIDASYGSALDALPPAPPSVDQGDDDTAAGDVPLVFQPPEAIVEAQATTLQAARAEIFNFLDNLNALIARPPPEFILDDIIAAFKAAILKDFSAEAKVLVSIIQTARTASQTASAAENSAAAKTAALSSTITVKATTSAVGLTNNEAQSLTSVVTGPLKALGAAAAIASTSDSLLKAALAALGSVGTANSASLSLVANLKAAADAASIAATKAATVVKSAIAASDAVLTTALAAAKAAGTGSKSSAAEAAAASGFQTEVAKQLLIFSDPDDPVTIADLTTLVDGVTKAAQDVANELPEEATLAAAITAAVKASTAAGLSATKASHSISLTRQAGEEALGPTSRS